ncbi:MAG TPA: hypothetical protein VGV15_08400 [Terriglobales bacterium]|nr:hypothetical protein [Terriglobales bacterium]
MLVKVYKRLEPRQWFQPACEDAPSDAFLAAAIQGLLWHLRTLGRRWGALPGWVMLLEYGSGYTGSDELDYADR